jgi:tRNA nucleotidyltransferase/poly(A) polymerase
MADQIIEPSGPRNSWDRRQTESHRAWTAFVFFRDSTDRKLKTVAETLKPPCSVANVSRWCLRHQWQARASDWDTHLDEEQRAELSRGRVARRRKQLQFASALQSIAASALRQIQARIEQRLPVDMAPEQVAGFLKLADQLEASAFGPEREHRWTKIVVQVGEYPSEQAYEDELMNRADLPGESA